MCARLNRQMRPLSFGHDLLPSYVAGKLVLKGHASAMYDRQSVFELEARQIADANLDMDPRYGPWLNPPFYAWVFVPLAKLPYRQALATFVGLQSGAAGDFVLFAARDFARMPRGAD